MKSLPFAYRQNLYSKYMEIKDIHGEVKAMTLIAQNENLLYNDVKKAIKGMNTSKGITAGKADRKTCDTLWAKAVKLRAGNKCEFPNCHKTDLQSHHIIPRSLSSALRYDLENGCCLCTGHHILFPNSAHKDATGFSEFIKTIRNIPYLESKRNNRTKSDYSAIKIYLENEIKKWT